MYDIGLIGLKSIGAYEGLTFCVCKKKQHCYFLCIIIIVTCLFLHVVSEQGTISLLYVMSVGNKEYIMSLGLYTGFQCLSSYPSVLRILKTQVSSRQPSPGGDTAVDDDWC